MFQRKDLDILMEYQRQRMIRPSTVNLPYPYSLWLTPHDQQQRMIRPSTVNLPYPYSLWLTPQDQAKLNALTSNCIWPGLENTRLFMSLTADAGTKCMEFSLLHLQVSYLYILYGDEILTLVWSVAVTK